MSLNKVMIIGNLGRDPEMRYTPNGQAVTQFTVAVNRNYKDQSGEWQEETEWFRIVAWGPLGERAAEYLRKGGKVYIEGRLQTRQWEGQDGQKRYTTELVANQITNLERRPREEGEPAFAGARPASRSADGGQPAASGNQPPAPGGEGEGDRLDASDLDDLPF
jgi:single-strand DNA-binding protein